MARVIDRLPERSVGGRRSKYPVDEWLDGRAWALLYGEDYRCKLQGIRSTLAKAATARGGGPGDPFAARGRRGHRPGDPVRLAERWPAMTGIWEALCGREGDATAVGGMVPGEIPGHGTGTRHETPSAAVTPPPARTCRNCGAPWNGGPEMLCEAHAEQYADFWADCSREMENER